MIIFSNPGELDLRLITTFGASLKNTKSPIGQFGTGLKYAIAGLLREGQEVEIYVGAKEVSFRADSQQIRGRTVSIVQMFDGAWIDCGFTTELGAHWEPWMFYRELYSNMLDEGGELSEEAAQPLPGPGTTKIIVRGPLLEEVHDRHEDYFVSTEALWTLPGVLEVHPASPSLITLKGIRMADKLASAKNAAFTYNLLGDHTLTEDRTLKNEYHARAEIAQALLQCKDEEILSTIIEDRAGLENLLDFDWAGTPPSEPLRKLALGAIKAKRYCPPTLRAALKRAIPAEVERAEEEQVPGTLSAMLDAAPRLPSTPSDDHYLRELEHALKQAITCAKYWQKCAEFLSEGVPYNSGEDHAV